MRIMRPPVAILLMAHASLTMASTTGKMISVRRRRGREAVRSLHRPSEAAVSASKKGMEKIAMASPIKMIADIVWELSDL